MDGMLNLKSMGSPSARGVVGVTLIVSRLEELESERFFVNSEDRCQPTLRAAREATVAALPVLDRTPRIAPGRRYGNDREDDIVTGFGRIVTKQKKK